MTKSVNLDNVETGEMPTHPLFKNLLLISPPKFNNLTVISYYGRRRKNNGYYQYYWLCECDCDEKNIKITSSQSLIEGTTKSCGCERLKNLKNRCITHGMSDSREYCIWKHIIQRCYNENCPEYKNYGGRGIVMCDEWKVSFANFFDDMGECPPDKWSIDRIDVNGNYLKTNCRWADFIEQNNNTRTNKYLEYNGKRLTYAQWAREIGVNEVTIRNRISYGWTIEEILSKPKNGQNIEYNGESHTLIEWAKILDINVNNLYYRIKRGWTIFETLSTPIRKPTDKRKKRLTVKKVNSKPFNQKLPKFNGWSFTISEWAKRLGVTYSIINHRLKKGWSLEKTLTTSPCRADELFPLVGQTSDATNSGQEYPNPN